MKEDAIACVDMAIAMQRRMRELQSEWRDAGLEKPFQLRIGINTGYCTVGNFGSEDRMDYTIIGGEVNLASRLQSHAEPGGILLSHETYSLVKDKVVAEEQDADRGQGLRQAGAQLPSRRPGRARCEQTQAYSHGAGWPAGLSGPADAGEGGGGKGARRHPPTAQVLSRRARAHRTPRSPPRGAHAAPTP